jgi:hypothetical protein
MRAMDEDRAEYCYECGEEVNDPNGAIDDGTHVCSCERLICSECWEHHLRDNPGHGDTIT